MFLRVLFVSILLGTLIFIQDRGTRGYFGDVHTSHYLLLASVYFISIIYAFLLKYLSNITLQAYIQLLVDTLMITGLIYSTGGIESIFSFLYILSIFSGSILLYRRGGMIAASSSSIFYGLLLDLHYYGVIHPLGSRAIYPETYQSAYLFFTILANMTGFYLVGYLSSFLSEQARKNRIALRGKQLDVNRLERLNESIIGSITSSLIVLDDHKKIILFNPAAEKIFGIEAKNACGHLIGDALPLFAEHSAGRQFLSTGLIETKSSFPDLSYAKPDGTKTYLRLSISPLLHSFGEQQGQILTLQDVTQKKQIEEEMKKVEGLALIGELAAGMAHEIRNPMASISGSIEIIRDEMEQNDVNVRLMNIILREIDRLNDLVADFLLFARPKRAKFREFDLNQLILDSLELFQNGPCWNSKIAIFTSFPDSVMVESDPDQLKQVLWNLFLNACDAMDGGGELHVASALVPGQPESGSEKAKIVIRDTGEGFDEKGLQHLFLPFFTTKERGSGLGLAIVKRIVDRLEGQISGANHPGGG
ncbi:MAG: ATP-binding protein, partial [Desulfobacteraceae bacterium]|nr:ATP-binding protein [Desulfobacteraceae bacterium]